MAPMGHQPGLNQGRHPGGGEFFFPKNAIRKMIRNLEKGRIREFLEKRKSPGSNVLGEWGFKPFTGVLLREAC